MDRRVARDPRRAGAVAGALDPYRSAFVLNMDAEGRQVLRAILADWKDGTLMLEEAAYEMARRAAAALGETIQERWQMEKAAFEGWVILEVMGHRRLAGYAREEAIGGGTMLRIDVPGEGDAVVATQYYNSASIFCITPTTEAIARTVARGSSPSPVTRWELQESMALPAARPEPEDIPPPAATSTGDTSDDEIYF